MKAITMIALNNGKIGWRNSSELTTVKMTILTTVKSHCEQILPTMIGVLVRAINLNIFKNPLSRRIKILTPTPFMAVIKIM